MSHDYNKIEKELKRAKTHQGRKYLQKKRLGLNNEGPKTTLFIRGNKTNDDVNNLLKELYLLKKDNSVMYSKRHDIHPMDDQSLIEKFCEKQMSSLFVFGNNQKKRPNNFVFGRLFENKILDMFEVGIENFKSIDQIKSNITVPAHSRPSIFFQGDIFEYNPIYMKIKNVLYDLFTENCPIKQIDIVSGLTYAIVISANDQDNDKIYFRTYAIHLNQNMAQQIQDGKALEDFEHNILTELGPHFDMVVRRDKWASEEAFKMACKQPRIIKKKENKNVSKDNVGDTKGRVYTDRQNLDQLVLRKRKKLKTNDKKEKTIENIGKEVKDLDI